MQADATPTAAVRSGLVQRLTRRPWVGWLSAQLAATAPITVTFVVVSAVGSRSMRFLLMYLLSLAGLLALQQLAILLLRRRIGTESASPADLLTLARASIGCTLVALVVAGSVERISLIGGIAFLTALIGATALDWLDGPLARRLGPTRLGAVLDIEADSWLTCACASAAVAWGELPWWVLVAPVVRYVHPALALLRGSLPLGGGPWWSRVTGVAQMTLFLGTLAPVEFAGRSALLAAVALPVCVAQFAALVALLTTSKSATAR